MVKKEYTKLDKRSGSKVWKDLIFHRQKEENDCVREASYKNESKRERKCIWNRMKDNVWLWAGKGEGDLRVKKKPDSRIPLQYTACDSSLLLSNNSLWKSIFLVSLEREVEVDNFFHFCLQLCIGLNRVYEGSKVMCFQDFTSLSLLYFFNSTSCSLSASLWSSPLFFRWISNHLQNKNIFRISPFSRSPWPEPNSWTKRREICCLRQKISREDCFLLSK